jgi:hypothetical protein
MGGASTSYTKLTAAYPKVKTEPQPPLPTSTVANDLTTFHSMAANINGLTTTLLAFKVRLYRK